MDVLGKHRGLILIILSWVLVGIVVGPVDYLYVPITLIVLKARNNYLEILVGFMILLILSDSREYSLQFASVAKEIYIIIMALLLFTDLESFTPLNKIFYWFIPFFAVAFFCLTNAPTGNALNSFQKTMSYMLLVFVVPNYVKKVSQEQGREFFRTLAMFATIVLLVGFVFKFISPDRVSREGRYQGIFGNPNGLGIFSLLLFMLLQVAKEMQGNLFSRRELIVIYGAIFLSVLLSGSRGSLFGILIFLAFSGLYRLSPIIGTIGAVVILASLSYILQNIVGFIDTLGLQDYLRSETLAQGSGRFVAWNFSWQHIHESFWFGRGFEYTEYLFNRPEYVLYLQNLGHQGNAHNSYITLWLDTGLIGLILYSIALLGSFLVGSSRTRLALPIMFAAVFSSFFESWLTASLNPFTIIIFTILALITGNAFIRAKNKAVIPVQ